MTSPWTLDPDRYFDTEPSVRAQARELYATVADLPLVCPHGHVNPRLFSDPNAVFGSPVDLFIIPDHYITRMLYSHGIPLEQIGVARRDGGETERDHRRIWRLFCSLFHLFDGTPSGVWLKEELVGLFGVDQRPDAANADRLYDVIAARLATSQFRPRALFGRFNVAVLATNNNADDPLSDYKLMHASGWSGDVRPTFRPDHVVDLGAAGWRDNVLRLGQSAGVDVHDYASYIHALEERRCAFKRMGATAADHGVETPWTEPLSAAEAAALFQRALAGNAQPGDAARFTAHMLIEMARMSAEDGLVMQLHAGSFRNHNPLVYQAFGPDAGGDIPVMTEFTRNLRPLLERFGNDPRLALILFTLDEATYSRELAPLAGHYPAVRLGPPWWFLDSLNGIRRYLDLVIDTTGLHKTTGFNDDTRAFCSIPARHTVWRRASANWVAEQVVRGVIDDEQAAGILRELAGDLARRAYRLLMP